MKGQFLMFPHITDQEFADAAAALEDRFEQSPLKETHEQRQTRVDRLGYGRWMTDYLTARARDDDHGTAKQRMLQAIEDVINPR